MEHGNWPKWKQKSKTKLELGGKSTAHRGGTLEKTYNKKANLVSH